jgi:hypothetical protein
MLGHRSNLLGYDPSAPASVAGVLDMQSKAGNAAVSSWLMQGGESWLPIQAAGHREVLAVQRDAAPAGQSKAEADSRGVATAGQSNDEGGPTAVTTLEQDMRPLLIDWQTGGLEGVNQFATNALSARLDDIESGSWQTFLYGLLGNAMWAATCFLPIGAAALAIFSISMAGVVVAASPTLPRKKKSAIPDIQQLAVEYINAIFAQLNAQVRDKASLLIAEHPDASRYRAIAAMVRHSFAPGMYDIDPTYRTIPQIKQSAVRDALLAFATERLKIATIVGKSETIGGGATEAGYISPTTTVTEVAWVQGKFGKPRLAIIETSFEGRDNGGGLQNIEDYADYVRRTFKSWVGSDMTEAAIQQWLASRHALPAIYEPAKIDELRG